MFKRTKYLITRFDYDRIVKIIDQINPDDPCVKKIKEKQQQKLYQHHQLNPGNQSQLMLRGLLLKKAKLIEREKHLLRVRFLNLKELPWKKGKRPKVLRLMTG